MQRSSILSVLSIMLCICRPAIAQTMQQAIAGGGSVNSAAGDYIVDFTVGEAVILTAGADPVLTQGFQQPIKATDFPAAALTLEATARVTYVQLDWTTSMETDNSWFYVERSGNGVTFITIDSLPSKAPGGNSNSPLQYKLADLQPLNGINYYRIRQVNRQGNISYSAMVSVMFNRPRWSVHIYPNPVSNTLRIKFISDRNTNCTFRIINVQGQVCMIRYASFGQGANNLSLNVEQLPAGIYFLEVTDHVHGQKQAVKLLKD